MKVSLLFAFSACFEIFGRCWCNNVVVSQLQVALLAESMNLYLALPKQMTHSLL